MESENKVAMSLIWQALREDKNLPSRTFFDVNARYTVDPLSAKSVVTPGGYKGYSLSLVIQMLSGSLLTAKMGFKIKSPYDLGYYFQAIDPFIFQPVDLFKRQNDLPIQQIKETKKKKGIKNILIPGERSDQRKKRVVEAKNEE